VTIFPLNKDKSPSCNEWQTYEGECTSAMYGVKVPTGFMVIDLDTYKGITRKDVEAVLGCELDWECSFSQNTLNGGEHYIFTVPEDITIKQGSDLFKLKGFDTRVSGKGYVATGKGYKVVGDELLEDHFDDFKPGLPKMALKKLTVDALPTGNDTGTDLIEAVKRDNLAVTNPDGSDLNGIQIKAIFENLPEEVGADNESWMTVCAGFKRQLLGMGHKKEKLSDRRSWGYKVLDAWSTTRGDYSLKVENSNFKRWCSFKADDTGNLITFASIIGMAGGLPSLKVDKVTGETVVSDLGFINEYVMNPGGKYISKDNFVEYSKVAFDTMHAKDTPTNSKGFNLKPSKVAEGVIEMVAGTMYAPSFPSLFTHSKVDYINTYEAELHEVVDQAVEDEAKKMLMSHLTHLIADKREIDIILDYLSFCVQNPGDKLPWAVVLQGAPGDGKSFFSEMMRLILGFNNVRVMNAQTLESNFSGWAAGQCMTFIEELKIDNYKKYETTNKLKPFISNPTVEQVKKGMDPVTIPNTTNYFCLTNHKDAIPMDDNDRRYCVIFSKWQSGKAIEEFLSKINPRYYIDLYENMRNSIPALYQALKNHEINTTFNAERRAPITASRNKMIELGKSPFKVTLEDALEEYPDCFDGGILNLTNLNREIRTYNDMHNDGRFEDYPNNRAIKAVLASMGFYYHERKKIDGNTVIFYKLD